MYTVYSMIVILNYSMHDAFTAGYYAGSSGRIIREFLGNEANPRPAISIDNSTWTAFAKIGLPNITSFDPYTDDNNWLLAAFALPYVGLTAYVGTNPLLNSRDAKAVGHPL